MFNLSFTPHRRVEGLTFALETSYAGHIIDSVDKTPQ